MLSWTVRSPDLQGFGVQKSPCDEEALFLGDDGRSLVRYVLTSAKCTLGVKTVETGASMADLTVQGLRRVLRVKSLGVWRRENWGY